MVMCLGLRSASFKVQVPAMPDKPEWRLNGQQLTITLPITDPEARFAKSRTPLVSMAIVIKIIEACNVTISSI